MKRMFIVFVALAFSQSANAANHGPLFGLATPTNSQGEWNFDEGIFDRTTSLGSQASFRELAGYGFTPHITLSFTLPVVIGNTPLPPTRIQAGADFDSTLAWRFQHTATKVGTRIESTAFAGLVVPGPQSAFDGIKPTNIPGFMVGGVTGTASLSHYLWLGGTYTRFVEHDGSKRPDVFDYSLVYGYRPVKWRRPPDKWDWRLFAELVGERSGSFLQSSVTLPNTQGHQVFLGPSALGIYRNYTVGFGAQFPIYQNVESQFPKERVRIAVNFSYLLFQHSH
ncbi:MAG TPA: hypothetical protein VHW45_18375 [Candidatus Sulfotelmatobacter sp.]|nr:hypothetical protein [Candidatus Sulfotelmatobacter sp.]